MPRVICLCLIVSALASTGRTQSPRFDLAIVRGIVVDGSGAARRRADVGIKDGRIVAVGTPLRGGAAQTIDAAGLIVAPGFIDVHTHADDLAANPRAENFVHMGVTSVVAGNCGRSALDVGDALTLIRETGASVNYATLIGHNTVRRAVMGTANRDASVAELARMRSLVWRAMADGAVGFSTGLEYVPGVYARTPEILDLARIAGNAGGVYASHMRNEGTELEAAVAETIHVGEMAGCRVQISHLKVDSPNRWGASTRALALIEAARARHVDVQADQYAYTAVSSDFAMSEDDVGRIMRSPWVSIASDSSDLVPGEGVPHPRGYGNNARVLGTYVRSRHVLTLEDAVRKMTSLPAEHFRFEKRGLIKEGYAADLTIFDPATIADTATFDKPHAFAEGVSYVFVNGVAVVRKGQHTGARPGEVLATTVTAK